MLLEKIEIIDSEGGSLRELLDSNMTEFIDRHILFIREFADLQYLYENNPQQLRKKIKERLIEDLITNFSLGALCRFLNPYNGDLFSKLQERHGNLTDNDFEVLTLIYAGFSSQQICALTKLKTVRCFYVAKSRIKKKLGLRKQDKLESYLDFIMSV